MPLRPRRGGQGEGKRITMASKCQRLEFLQRNDDWRLKGRRTIKSRSSSSLALCAKIPFGDSESLNSASDAESVRGTAENGGWHWQPPGAAGRGDVVVALPGFRGRNERGEAEGGGMHLDGALMRIRSAGHGGPKWQRGAGFFPT